MKRQSREKPSSTDLEEAVKAISRGNDELETLCHILKRISGQKAAEHGAFNTRMKNFEQYKHKTPEWLDKKLQEFHSEQEKLAQEYAQLQETCEIIRRTPREKYQFISNNFNELGDNRLLNVLKALKMHPSSYYSIRNAEQARRKKDAGFEEALFEICSDKNKEYSVTKVAQQLRAKNKEDGKQYHFTYKPLKMRMEKLGIKVKGPAPRSPKNEPRPLTTKDKDMPLEATMPTTLKWRVLPSGYTWETCDAAEYFKSKFHTIYCLIPKDCHCKKKDKTYLPLKDNALFAKFADMDSTEESFLEWANNYGSLFSPGEIINGMYLLVIPGRYKQVEYGHTDESGQFKYYHEHAESYKTWSKEHRELKRAVHVWELWDNSLWNRDGNGAKSLRELKEMLSCLCDGDIEGTPIAFAFHKEEEEEKKKRKDILKTLAFISD